MPESIVPYILLPASVLVLMFGGMMFWDTLSACGVSRGPDAFALRNRFFARLLKQARLVQDPTTSSKWVMCWRLFGIWGIGVYLLSLAIIEALGSR